VEDFMPVLGREVTANHRLVRMVRACAGGCGSGSTSRRGLTAAGGPIRPT
jgi:hypothetical protein